MSATERSLLLAPGPIARAAALVAREPVQRWMLCQPLEVRRSYVAGVLDRPDLENAAEIWLSGSTFQSGAIR